MSFRKWMWHIDSETYHAFGIKNEFLLEISHNSDFKSHRENISISSLKRKLFLGREPRGARSLDSSGRLGEESVVSGHCAQSRVRG